MHFSAISHSRHPMIQKLHHFASYRYQITPYHVHITHISTYDTDIMSHHFHVIYNIQIKPYHVHVTPTSRHVTHVITPYHVHITTISHQYHTNFKPHHLYMTSNYITSISRTSQLCHTNMAPTFTSYHFDMTSHHITSILSTSQQKRTISHQYHVTSLLYYLTFKSDHMMSISRTSQRYHIKTTSHQFHVTLHNIMLTSRTWRPITPISRPVTSIWHHTISLHIAYITGESHPYYRQSLWSSITFISYIFHLHHVHHGNITVILPHITSHHFYRA